MIYIYIYIYIMCNTSAYCQLINDVFNMIAHSIKRQQCLLFLLLLLFFI